MLDSMLANPLRQWTTRHSSTYLDSPCAVLRASLLCFSRGKDMTGMAGKSRADR
jgi:hypothetical protein